MALLLINAICVTCYLKGRKQARKRIESDLLNTCNLSRTWSRSTIMAMCLAKSSHSVETGWPSDANISPGHFRKYASIGWRTAKDSQELPSLSQPRLNDELPSPQLRHEHLSDSVSLFVELMEGDCESSLREWQENQMRPRPCLRGSQRSIPDNGLRNSLQLVEECSWENSVRIVGVEVLSIWFRSWSSQESYTSFPTIYVTGTMNMVLEKTDLKIC